MSASPEVAVMPSRASARAMAAVLLLSAATMSIASHRATADDSVDGVQTSLAPAESGLDLAHGRSRAALQRPLLCVLPHGRPPPTRGRVGTSDLVGDHLQARGSIGA